MIKINKKMSKGRKFFWKIEIIIAVFLLLLIWGGFFLIQNLINKNIDLKYITEDDYSFVFQVDCCKENGKKFILEGWAFKLNQNTEKKDIKVLLYDMEKKDIIYSKMKYSIREDVNQYFFCEYDYSNSGFVAGFKLKELDLKNKNYEVIIKDNNGVLYKTGTFISDGELMYTNPNEFEAIDVAGTNLSEIISNGILRAYCPNVGVYVYQYKNELFWIVKKEYPCWDSNNNSYMQFHLATTQPLKLPSYRVENQWDFDDKGFDFVEHERIGIGGDMYRVSVFELPKEYSITYVGTGYWTADTDWYWKAGFRPYFFEK